MDQNEINRERTTRMLSAAIVVRAAAKATGLARGSVDCPLCTGKVRFAVNPPNGHVRAACETPDCFSFIE
ncbi:MAG: hypothetical protein PW843_24350 [Azospirillaceae bacterium]|nr:hypothetical protein [Azospirillaceae bacterium]